MYDEHPRLSRGTQQRQDDDREYSRKDSRSPPRGPRSHRDHRYRDAQHRDGYQDRDRDAIYAGSAPHPSSDPPYDFDKARFREVRRSRERHDRDEDPLPYDERDIGQRRSRSRGEHSSPAGGRRHAGRRRSRSRSPIPYAKSRPVLILEDVPDDAVMRDIELGLDVATDYDRFSVDIIDKIEIRKSRRGGRIAMAEFFEISDAEEFQSRYRTEIPIKLSARSAPSRTFYMPFRISWPDDSSRRIDRRDDERRRSESWLCYECRATNYPDRTFCYRCKVERPADLGENEMHDYGPKLTGETDQDPQQMPSQYVVVRGLDSAVDEDVLAKGMEQLYIDTAAPSKEAGENSAKPKLKSTAPTKSTTGLGARPHSLRRVFLMRDRRNDVTWKYGFAEFATAQDAQSAMAKFHGMEQFKINSKPVFVAFIHTGVFIPANGSADEGRFSFAPIYNEDILLKYWDDRGYASALVVNAVSDMGTEEETAKAKSTPKDAKDTQSARDILKKVKKDVTAREKKPAIMASQVQMWARKRAELEDGTRKAGSVDNASTPEIEKRDPPKTKYGLPRQLPALNADQEEPIADKDDGAAGRAMHRRDTLETYGVQSGANGEWTCTLCAEAEVFTTHQAMIDHHILDAAHTSALQLSEKLTRADAALTAKGAAKHRKHRRQPRLRSDAAPEYISYADNVHLVCLVCDPPRRFTSRHVLRLHETESILHKEAMTNPDNIVRAVKRLNTLRLRPRMMKPKQQSDSSNDPAYRDRARERRTAFSQKSKPKADSAARDKQDVGKDADNEAKKPSKGAALLGKMGWAAGSGLGAEGTGRTDIIASELYVPGVGLGAAGGKAGDAAEEAARNTRGEFSDFVQKTRDKARERYERMV